MNILPNRLLLPIVNVLAAYKQRMWTPKELHLSADDWWELRDEIRAVRGSAPEATFEDGRLGMMFHDVRIVVNVTFERANYRFDPIAPETVRAHMVADLSRFQRGIKKV